MSDLKGLTILLVEDDFLIQLDLRTVLEEAEAMVVTASSLAEALRLSADSFDAAVLDIRLPDGEVFPLAERLDAANVPLIFHSGNVEGEQLIARFPGAAALSKPVPETILVRTVQRSAERAA